MSSGPVAVFVTGTDTGCGKTTAACALARHARASGARVRVLKPIETGCEPGRDGLRALDALALAEAAADDAPAERLCPYRLSLPAAPEIAARVEGRTLELEPIRTAFAEAARDADWLIVEGAGGIRVPIAPGLDMAGLAHALGLTALVIARASLGTINHTQLTLEAARNAGLPVAGVLFNHTEPDLSAADRQNLELLKEKLGDAVWGELAFGARAWTPAPDLEALARRCTAAGRRQLVRN